MQSVAFYDAASNKVINIPASELAQNAVQVQIKGRPGLVWMLIDQIKPGKYLHGPFQGDLKNKIERIQQAFFVHSCMTYENWEDNLRRDSNPEAEIELFLHCVEVYEEFARFADNEEELEEIYKVVVTCSMTKAKDIWKILKVKSLTRKKADQIISRFYSDN
jgi:hypothetical protein